MGTGALILVVDDDPFMREITRMHLEGAGYEVALATSAAEGLQKARGLTFPGRHGFRHAWRIGH